MADRPNSLLATTPDERQNDAPDQDALIAIDELPVAVPGWKPSVWTTRKWIRDGLLGTVAVGRRRYVTRRILKAFVALHTIPGSRGDGGQVA